MTPGRPPGCPGYRNRLAPPGGGSSRRLLTARCEPIHGRPEKLRQTLRDALVQLGDPVRLRTCPVAVVLIAVVLIAVGLVALGLVALGLIALVLAFGLTEACPVIAAAGVSEDWAL